MALQAEYRIDCFDASGLKVAEISDYYELSYVKKVNEPGLAMFILEGNHRDISKFVHDGIVKIMRRNIDPDINLDWYVDFIGLYRGEESWNREGKEYFKAIVPGDLKLLDDYIIAFTPSIIDKTSFTNKPSETVMKNIVKYNATSLGTVANGRKRNATLKGITVASDTLAGNNITSDDFAYDTLLGKLQDLAKISGDDFSLTLTSGANWVFNYHVGQLGTNRTSTVTFSLDRGNMANPKYTYDRTNEKTFAIIAGAGTNTTRVVTLTSGANWSLTNDIETFVDASNSGTVISSLVTKGKEKLDTLRAREYLTFDVLQTVATYYGLHYFLGDKVTSIYKNHTIIQKVQGISVSYKNGNNALETIKVELRQI